jgi:DNA transformation protein and related proteins
MPVTESFVEFVLEQLDPVGGITSKRMFGGVGVYSGDLFFALLDNDVLFFKVDDSNRADFESAGMAPFQPYGPAGEVMQYYQVPVSVLEHPDELAGWAAKAIAVARVKKGRARKSSPKKRRPKNIATKPRPAKSRKSR